MGKKKPITPKSQIVSSLRHLWLYSRERREAIRRDKNTCQCCGAKGSAAKGREVKTEVHHLQEGDINWDRIVRTVRAELLCDPKGLMTVCRECHKEIHERGEV